MKKILSESQRMLKLNSFLNESIDDAILHGQQAKLAAKEVDVDEGLGTMSKNIKRGIAKRKQKGADKKEVKSLLSTHKQGLDNIKWAHKEEYMDPQVSPGRNTYQKALKSSELRDVKLHIHGKKPVHVKNVTGTSGSVKYPEGRDIHGKPWKK